MENSIFVCNSISTKSYKQNLEFIMKLFRGWIGEKKTAFYLWLALSNKSYPRYHNIILPSKNGTTQIDHLIISVFGLFIVETKNKKGWIFGSENQDYWTQSIYGNNYSFQNPLKQTYRQKVILSEFLNINKSKIQTVIYFVGECAFATDLPENVIKSSIGKYIKRFQNQIISTDDVNRIIDAIETQLDESSLTKRDHIKSLQTRHSSTTTCPNCGSKLVERTVKKGVNQGTKFLGCENYPKCKFSKEIC
jgi:restriction system protein